MVRIATANGPTTAVDVVDVEVLGLDDNARVVLLKGCPAVLSLGRVVQEHKCSFVWNDDGAVLIDHAGRRHECVVRNYVPFLGQDYAFLAPDTGTEDAVPEASADDRLGQIMPESHDERGKVHPGMIHDLTHLRKRHDCDACQAKIKMSPATRKNPHLRERPTGWAHTLLADHLSSSDLKVDLSSPKPGHTMGGSGRHGAGRTAGRGDAGQNKVPTIRWPWKPTAPLAFQRNVKKLS